MGVRQCWCISDAITSHEQLALGTIFTVLTDTTDQVLFAAVVIDSYHYIEYLSLVPLISILGFIWMGFILVSCSMLALGAWTSLCKYLSMNQGTNNRHLAMKILCHYSNFDMGPFFESL